MRVLVIGNLGYVGPLVVERLRTKYPDSYLIGFDIGYYEHVLTTISRSPESLLDVQYYGDVRQFPSRLMKNVDAVVYLAAISNDPMGKKYDIATHEINHDATVKVAKKSKEYGVKNFVFASSCSVYGFAEEVNRTEDSEVAPLTAYASSKINAESDLSLLADDYFIVTCLRFATACGFSPRLRLDLVLNDFVASAIATGKIDILSDGTPWRPLIHVKDMARAIDWAINRATKNGGKFLIINAGSNDWNYQIRELAESVKGVMPGIDIKINKNAISDKRSYMVDFSLFKKLAPDFYPKISLQKAVEDLLQGLNNIKFNDKNFRESHLIRLNILNEHIESNRLYNELQWVIN